LRESPLKAFQEEPAIRKSGECIVQDIMRQLLLDFLAGGYIPVDDDQLVDLSLRVANGDRRRLQNAPASILMSNAVLQALANAGLPRLPRGFQNAGSIVRVNLLEYRCSSELCGRVAQHLVIGGAVVEAPALYIHEGIMSAAFSVMILNSSSRLADLRALT